MVCIRCWYFHNIKSKIWYPIKAKILRFKYKIIKPKATIMVSSYAIAEIYDGPIEDGKLVARYIGKNKWQEYGLNQLLYLIGGPGSPTGYAAGGSMAIGTLCDDTAMAQVSTFAPWVLNTWAGGTYPDKYNEWVSDWSITGEIANICQAALQSAQGATYWLTIYNFGTAFTKQDGQSLRITYRSTFSAV